MFHVDVRSEKVFVVELQKAGGALLGLLPLGVGQHVTFQDGCPEGDEIAVRAFAVLDAQMSLLVHQQIPLLIRLEGANIASIWSLTRVDSLVNCHVALGESLSACLTGLRAAYSHFLSVVCSAMYHQVCSRLKIQSTFAALTLLLVSYLVVCKTSFGEEG